MKEQDTSQWPLMDVMKATAVFKDLGNFLTEDAITALLMPGSERRSWSLEGESAVEFKERLDDRDRVETERFIHTLRVGARVARAVADGLESTIEAMGFGELPDPDTVTIPDTVPEEWES